ncbi:tRNA 2-thiouridine(34) synthase MnmA [Patescibacteria group bacterium]|nr:tRNA 2-thiouridine(34) synthase MnmA [Patescibacteria group bacterium]
MFGKNKGKVFVGLSGGVDSAVSAALLQSQGYDVTGVFIRIALPGYPCSAGADRIDAMRVATHLQIPFLEIDLSESYAKEVFASSLSGFKKGRTPNPDTLCNREIKFGAFFNFAMEQGADFVATGHYAQTKDGLLYAGKDPSKDQSYFLWMVKKEILEKTIFPVGNLEKTEVRALAEKFKLPNARRKDSQGLCFLGEVSIEDMLHKELSPVPGDVLSETGEVIGRHEGTPLYTLGQRHGFTLSSQTPDTKAHFVIEKDIEFNTITVSTERFPHGVTKTDVTLIETNWIGELQARSDLAAQYRYHQTLIPVEIVGETHVVLGQPHYMPLGQSLVLYTKEGRCLGGGIVDKSDLTA